MLNTKKIFNHSLFFLLSALVTTKLTLKTGGNWRCFLFIKIKYTSIYLSLLYFFINQLPAYVIIAFYLLKSVPLLNTDKCLMNELMNEWTSI